MKIITILLLLSGCACTWAQTTFEPVVPGQTPTFPQFHNLQKQFQSQWWYVTANLKGEDGKDYGAQFTLFSNALDHHGQPRRIHFAHAALSTPTNFYHAERYARDDMKHGGQQARPWLAFLDHWQFSGSSNAPLPGTLNVSEPKFGYRLNLSASPYFLLGDQGFSKKNRDGSLASYYYNAPFIEVDGEIVVEGRKIKVTGEAWYDRELSSGIFAPKGSANLLIEGIGWDWLSLHLDKDRALMLYRVRSNDEVYLDGVLIHRNGEKTALDSQQIQWQSVTYKSFGKHSYPVVWQLKIPSRQIDIKITPLHEDQLVNGSIPYWEGAVSTSGSHQAKGYLELFGY